MSLDAMKQALAVLEEVADEVFSPYDNKLGDAILALRAAIEQAQKPVAWFTVDEINEWAARYLEKHPDQETRQWQGLTDEDCEEILRWVEWKEIGSQPVAPQKLIAYVEKKLREKNNG